MLPGQKISLVVMGSGGVGKSAITISFINNQFMEEYDPTIEDSYSKNLFVDEVEYQLEITDTAGQEEYRGLWSDQFLQSADGFILVYSITLKSSFEELTFIRNQIMRVREDEQCPMIIVGNKCDLGDLREVQETEAKEWAKSINALQIESSAKSSINIGQIFTDVTREVIRLSNQPKASATAAETSDKAGGCCLIM
ncbi:hypothetical protein CONCODRAFT_9851 [Conidiobolus coronatus NRRL 28638]|uniref:Ras-domain-containing protein n=1 Tax=Conidiobolus coronatus (strain ATCC 28846 / CBS 209.66 / NRRL 28638) TaxID=796925 RepID=A0A137NZD7_CONC2|nr:hypothetical protein CONCODRAFT_9851 [Conidiobolus coronatus NRRL 28638]|eukprot:KXN67994.1 hypothetical protein CONCODRAFT_9851 [Conidiobolus coronatus NRRL 28638]